MGSSPSTRRRNQSQSSDKDSIHDKHDGQHLDDNVIEGGDSDVNESLNICNLPSTDPLVFFEKWYRVAKDNEGIKMVNIAVLSTASRSGRTSSRIVSVKGFGQSGFKIATNSNSLKAKNMEENPFASLIYHWGSLGQMVRIDGHVKLLPDEEMNKRWKDFSRDAQLMHIASRQDEIIKSSEEVLARKEELEMRYKDYKQIPVNKAWCAYALIPEVIEFHQIGEFMDRIRFRKLRAGERPDGVLVHEGQDGWVIETVSP